MSATIFFDTETIEIDQAQLDEVKRAARQATLKRARLCLHKDHSDKIQEMVIAVCRGSYICPHRQMNKSKSYMVIEGSMLVIFFNDDGHVIRRVKMGATNSDNTFLYRFSSSTWHTVVPLSEVVIYVEVIAGPYIREETEFATWAPDQADTDGARAFLARTTA